MMTLWGRKSSINVQKVLWVLAELGLQEGSDFKQIDAGLHFGINKTPEYLKLNPNGLLINGWIGKLVLYGRHYVSHFLVSPACPSKSVITLLSKMLSKNPIDF